MYCKRLYSRKLVKALVISLTTGITACKQHFYLDVFESSFDPYEEHNYGDMLSVMFTWLSVPPSILHWKNLNVAHYMQTLKYHFFSFFVVISALLIGTLDFYHLIPLSVTLNLTGVTRWAQSQTPCFHFLPLLWVTSLHEAGRRACLWLDLLMATQHQRIS